MVKTPRTRSGGKKEPTTIDLTPEEVRHVEPSVPPGSAEAAFAVEESLTPGESAAAAPIGTPGTGTTDTAAERAEAITPEQAEAADSFRFSEAMPDAPATAPDAPRDDAPSDAAASPAPEPELVEETPQPGDATTPLFANPAPNEEPAPRTAAVAAPEPRRRTGRLVAAGFTGGAAALLLAALLQYAGALPSLSAGSGNETAAMQTELAALRSEVAGLRENAAAPDASLSSALDTLRADVSALQGGSADAKALGDRLAALESQVQGLGADTVSADQIASLSQQATSAGQAGEENRAAIDGAVKRLDTLEGTVSGMQGKVDALSEQPRIALALAASGLKEAADRGVPFEAELATLKAIAPDLPGAADLEPYAASGVPTRDAIREAWDAAAQAMVATETGGTGDAGLVGRLWSGASGLVSVRPVGAVEGTSTAAIVSRMEAALDGGDLGKALSEYDTLPEAAKQAGAGWAEKARARTAAETLIDAAIADAMKGA